MSPATHAWLVDWLVHLVVVIVLMILLWLLGAPNWATLGFGMMIYLLLPNRAQEELLRHRDH